MAGQQGAADDLDGRAAVQEIGAARPDAPRGRGRPALGEREGCSPRVVFRVPGEVKQALQNLARHTGRRESDLAREALERFLAQEG